MKLIIGYQYKFQTLCFWHTEILRSLVYMVYMEKNEIDSKKNEIDSKKNEIDSKNNNIDVKEIKGTILIESRLWNFL